MKLIGWGSFREVYKVEGHNLVVKFPISDTDGFRDIYHTSKVHNRAELRRIAQLSRIPEFKRHLPKIHYYDDKSGVMVMTYYKKFNGYVHQFESTMTILQKAVKRLTKVDLGDLRQSNIHQTKRGDAVLVDLGY